MEDGICNCDDGVIVQAIHKMKKYLELANDTNVPSKNGWIPVSDKLPEAGDGKYYPLLNVQTSYGAVKCGFTELETIDGIFTKNFIMSS